jgi:surfeit locus 1 family protein
MASVRLPHAPRKSLIGPTVFTVFGLALLLGLGTWQVQRLHWKEALIAQRTAAVSAAPVPLPRTLAAARELDFRRVRATGRFLNDRELLVHWVAPDGEAGYHVVTPLALAGGGTLLVDRGFVPERLKSPASRTDGNPVGPTAVTGLLRLTAGKPGWFVPDNRPDRNEWFYVDAGAMAAADRIADALPFTVDADATPNPGGFPVGGQTPLDLPNHHLQYAITWYALAACLAIIYVMLVRRRRIGAPP